jgi:hypothetical protein
MKKETPYFSAMANINPEGKMPLKKKKHEHNQVCQGDILDKLSIVFCFDYHSIHFSKQIKYLQ